MLHMNGVLETLSRIIHLYLTILLSHLSKLFFGRDHISGNYLR